jgi:ubiquinone/menaquinone biosynthesis C-methylase UbiE
VTDQSRGDAIYAVGFADAERQRLMLQGRLFAETTHRLFVDAGIEPGMRVLDVGCGVGDVSLLAASLVGPSGAVVGIDSDARSLELARERTAAAGYSQVTFQQSDLRELPVEQPFDAVVGRFVLMYLGDVAQALRQLAAHVRPGGVVAFQEFQFDYTPFTYPHAPLVDQCRTWMLETFQRAGMDTQMAMKLHSMFLRAGLPAPHMHMDLMVCSRTNDLGCDVQAEVIRSILPLLERFGIATAAEVNVETLAQRLRQETIDDDVVWTAPPVMRAWTRRPAGAEQCI